MRDPALEFAEFYHANYGALLAHIGRRVGDHELARDLTADAFRIAWTRWSEERHPDRAWLFVVARNLIGGEYRRRARRPEFRAVEDLGTSDAESAADVRAVLSTLTERDREVLMLTYWDGLDAGETGRVLGVSRAAIWMRLSRARRAFRAAWTADSGLSSAPRAQAAR